MQRTIDEMRRMGADGVGRRADVRADGERSGRGQRKGQMNRRTSGHGRAYWADELTSGGGWAR